VDPRRWQLERRTQLYWRRLDDEWVAYDSGSGDTHRLDGISAAVLMCLEVDAHDLDGLAQLLVSELDLPEEGLTEKLEGLLAQLSRLGLIESAES
jgi:PqqD family protein of HPr-rel-A system